MGLEFGIPIYYVNAIVSYSGSFNDETDMNYAYFIATYISLIITKDRLIITKEISEELAQYHDENSDIATLYNVLSILLCSKDKSMNKLRYCFSKINDLKDQLIKISNHLFKDRSFYGVMETLPDFVKKEGGIYNVIDKFIENINFGESFEKNWKDIHSFDFQGIRKTKTNKNPELIFLGDDILKCYEEQTNGKIFLIKRPGWKGLTAPSHCYCFNIEYKMENGSYSKLIGHLIHRKGQCEKAILNIEIKSTNVLNPWFNVLLDSYFNDKTIQDQNNTESTQNQAQNKDKKIKFYYTTLGNNVYVSFNNTCDNDDDYYDQIKEGVDKCLVVFPHTPRGVLIYNQDLNIITETRSLGSNDFVSQNATSFYGARLNRQIIEDCFVMEDCLSDSYPVVTICSLFLDEKCEYSHLDHDNLYVSCQIPLAETHLLDVVQKRYEEMKKKKEKIKKLRNNIVNGFFQFSPQLIHPSLIYVEKLSKRILDWFKEYCPFVNVQRIEKHRFKMKLSEIQELQDYLFKHKDEIIEQMKLKYVATSFPKELQKEIINGNKKWIINTDFNTIVSPIEDQEEVNDYIQKKIDKNTNKIVHQDGCVYGCNRPEFSELTFTIFYKERIAGSMKVCKQCILETLKIANKSFYLDEVDENSLKRINEKPCSILIYRCDEYNHGNVRYPLIPFGQYISVIFGFNDNELCSLLSAYLRSINEFTIRYRMRKIVTFCRNHPQTLYKIEDDSTEIKCNIQNCNCTLCRKCFIMHDKNDDCQKKLPNGNMYCPGCRIIIEKTGACNVMTCRCGTIFCFKCGDEASSYTQAEEHFIEMHSSIYNRDMVNNDNDNNNGESVNVIINEIINESVD